MCCNTNARNYTCALVLFGDCWIEKGRACLSEALRRLCASRCLLPPPFRKLFTPRFLPLICLGMAWGDTHLVQEQYQATPLSGPPVCSLRSVMFEKAMDPQLNTILASGIDFLSSTPPTTGPLYILKIPSSTCREGEQAHFLINYGSWLLSTARFWVCTSS